MHCNLKICRKKFLYNYKYLCIFALLNALVAELVDALDSKSSVFGRVGSIPTQGTTNHKKVELQASLNNKARFFI